MKALSRPHLFRGLQNRGRLDQNAKDKLDLTRLRARRGEKPRTKTGQIRQAWPHIKDLFDAGRTLKDIQCVAERSRYSRSAMRGLSTYLGQLEASRSGHGAR